MRGSSSSFASWSLTVTATLALYSSLSAVQPVAAMAKDKFPLIWLCVGLTAAGIIIAFYIAYRRPDEEVPIPNHPMGGEDLNTESMVEDEILADEIPIMKEGMESMDGGNEEYYDNGHRSGQSSPYRE